MDITKTRVVYNGKTYRWIEDKSVCKGCYCKDKCKDVCNNIAGYMKLVENGK